MKYFSMFSGIGGFELALQEHQCIGYSEIDKYAIQIYEKHFKGHKNHGDATRINPVELPDFDLLVGGFPCQAFSVAGKRAGFSDTRGTLFFDVARILAAKTPRLVVLENVKGLLTHENGVTFQTILRVLTDLGYWVEWQVLNSKDFGVPQNRERVFIVGHFGGKPSRQIFPIRRINTKNIEQINSSKQQTDRIYSTDGIAPTLPTGQVGRQQPLVVEYDRNNGLGKELDIAHTLNSSDWRGLNRNQKQNAVVHRVPLRFLTRNQKNIKGDYSFTVDTSNSGGLCVDVRVRRLTPLECERLQGFPDGWTKGLSDSQRYKCLGNAVTVNVVQAIVSDIKENQ